MWFPNLRYEGVLTTMAGRMKSIYGMSFSGRYGGTKRIFIGGFLIKYTQKSNWPVPFHLANELIQFKILCPLYENSIGS